MEAGKVWLSMFVFNVIILTPVRISAQGYIPSTYYFDIEYQTRPVQGLQKKERDNYWAFVIVLVNWIAELIQKRT